MAPGRSEVNYGYSQVLPALDHLCAMHSDVVVPLLQAWLGKVGRQQ